MQSGPWAIAIDDTNLYWSNLASGTIMTAPLDGGAAVPLITGQGGIYGLAVDSNDIYWVNTTGAGVAGTVRRAPKR